MKKLLTLIALCMIAFNAIHAEITWTLSDDGTLTISGTDMPLYASGMAPWYYQRDKIKKIVIEDGVKNISYRVFESCTSLTSITIPNSVASIEDCALANCLGLTSIIVEQENKNYDSRNNCNAIIEKQSNTLIVGCKKTVIPNSVTSIGGHAFYRCSGLTSITIPNSVTTIGEYAFEDCSGLTSITIPNSVTSIGGHAFYRCSGLTSITIPNSVTSIGGAAFEECSGLTSVTIPNSVTSIGRYAFSGCSGLASVTIPNSVTNIENCTFSRCSGLTSVTIPNSVTSIGHEAFRGCTALTSITIPNSVTSIGKDAFDGSNWYNNQPDGLVYAGLVLYKYKGTMPPNTNIDIKEGIKGIGDYAFYQCSGLTSITIPNSVTSIGDRAFLLCRALASITIPNSVTSIGDQAFNQCSGLTSITIPNSVTSIGNSAFLCCRALASITIPNSVTSIEEQAFSGCSGLTSVNIPNSVTSIGNSAFYGCSGLTSVTIPESVTSIGHDAFYGTKLRNIVIKAKTPPSGEMAFSYHDTTLMIPEGSRDAYAHSDNWYKFINVREMTYNTVNLTNSKAYTIRSATEGAYLFYDSVNDCVGVLNETAFDDTEENNTWMSVEVDGKNYVYNLGAKKFLMSDKANTSKTGYSLSDTPVSIDIEDGKDAIVFGKGKEFYMVINDKLNVDEGLESQIIATTGIKGISVDANQPTVTYNVNGQLVPNNTKGLHIRNGKKVVIK